MNTIPTMHLIAAIITGVYGLVSLIGGIMGYVNAASKESLIAGGASGIILLVCAGGILRLPFWSSIVAIIVALALIGFFVSRFVRNLQQLGEYLSSVRGATALVMIIGGVITIAATALVIWTRGQPPSGS
jgi:uncharacterized membrane protein (UPF0136 family)